MAATAYDVAASVMKPFARVESELTDWPGHEPLDCWCVASHVRLLDRLKVRVLGVDLARKRISLSAKST